MVVPFQLSSQREMSDRSLYYYRSRAQERGDSLFSGTFAFTGDVLKPIQALEKWVMVFVVAAELCYLYTRSITAAALTVLILCLLDSVVFALLAWATKKSASPIETTHSRDKVLVTDLIAGVLAGIASYIVFEYTALGTLGVGSDILVAQAMQSTLRTVLVLLSTFTLGYVRLYWFASPFVLLVIWIFYLVDIGSPAERPYSLWLAQRATIVVLFNWVAFIQPWHKTFLGNAILAVFGFVFVACFVEFLFQQQ